MRPRFSGLREHRIDMGVFDCPILLVVCKDVATLQSYVRWKHREPEFVLSPHPCGSRGLCISKDGFIPIIWIPRHPRTPREYSTVAHEAFHAVCKVMDWAAIPLTSVSYEAYAHTLGHIVNEILTNA